MRLRVAPLCVLIGLLVSGCIPPTAPTSNSKGAGKGSGSGGTRIIRMTGSMVFGLVRVGTSASAAMTIHNDGDVALTVTGFTGPGSIMADTRATPTGGTVAPGDHLDVTITFSPTVAQRYHGNIRVTSNATSGTDAIEFEGYGSLNGVPIFARSGTGDDVFDIPAYVAKLQITGTYTGSSTDFLLWVGSQNVECGIVLHASCRLLVDTVLGTSVGRTSTSLTKLIEGGGVTKTVRITTGAAWSVSETR